MAIKIARLASLAALSCTLLLAACGGGGTHPAAEAVQPALTLLAGSSGGPGEVDGLGPVARLQGPMQLWIDPHGNLVVFENSGLLRTVTPEGAVSTPPQDAFRNSLPVSFGSVFDAQGNTYVTDETLRDTIWKVSPSNQKTLFAGIEYTPGRTDGPRGQGTLRYVLDMASDGQGGLYVLDGESNGAIEYFWTALRRLSPDGAITTVAGGEGATNVDGPANTARFPRARQIAVDGRGNVFLSDGQTIRRFDPAGQVTTIAASDALLPFIDDIAADAAGNLYASGGNAVLGVLRPGSEHFELFAGMPFDYGPARDGQGADARFSPFGVLSTAADGADVLVLSRETAGYSIRRVTPAGNVTTEIPLLQPSAGGRLIAATGYAYDPGRRVHYLAVSNTECLPEFCQLRGSAVWRLERDGTWAEIAGAADPEGSHRTSFGHALVGPDIDAQGNVYVVDGSRLVRITPAGTMTTVTDDLIPPVAGGIESFGVDSGGTAYALAYSPEGQTLHRVTPDGRTATVGAPGSIPAFTSSPELAIDPEGNVYVPQGFYVGSTIVIQAGSILKVTPDGEITRFAGNPTRTGIALGALPGQFYAPAAMVWTPEGLVFASGRALLRIAPLR
ncbi:hypothetical protein [Ramlibacter sp. PS4R-6]|uniref:hypothetical protein n=1 Tax=Ramlibacter sp. PS4R-6 TaxID=3133438 RepID=UPI0030998797